MFKITVENKLGESFSCDYGHTHWAGREKHNWQKFELINGFPPTLISIEGAVPKYFEEWAKKYISPGVDPAISIIFNGKSMRDCYIHRLREGCFPPEIHSSAVMVDWSQETYGFQQSAGGA